MLYVGLDVHVKSITMCVLGDDGQVILRQTLRQLSELLRALAGLPGGVSHRL